MEVKKNSMFKRMLEKMMAQYRPTKSGQLRMTFDGTIVLKKTNPTGESYIGINNDGAIVSYEPEFVMDFPVYLIDPNQVPIASGRKVHVIQKGASEGMEELMRLLVD